MKHDATESARTHKRYFASVLVKQNIVSLDVAEHNAEILMHCTQLTHSAAISCQDTQLNVGEFTLQVAFSQIRSAFSPAPTVDDLVVQNLLSDCAKWSCTKPSSDA